jgi:hypothetical protein
MRLNELMDKIIGSSRSDWHKITCWGANTGPSYHNAFTFYDTWQGNEGVLQEDSHSNVAVYIPDVSITLAFGLRALADFKEEWANKFPDSHASSSYVDVFYNNALVFRDVYVTVDGGRANLPLPTRKFDKATKSVIALEVPEKRRAFIRLVQSLEGSVRDFDEYFGDAEFKTVNVPWPTFGQD